MANRSSTRELSDEERDALASRVRMLAESIGTHAQAAELVGCSVSQLRQYLAAQSVPSLIIAAKLAQATGRSLDWLMTGEGSATPRAARERPLDRQLAVAEWRAIAIKEIRESLPSLFANAVTKWDDDTEDDIGGAILALIENSVALIDERPRALTIALEAQRIALAAVRGEALPDYGPVE